MNRTIDPLVRAAWLQDELDSGLVVIDIRFQEEYDAGHIPGAISVPFGLVSAWSESDDRLLLELPPAEALFEVIGACGITPDSRVVVVGRLEEAGGPPYPLADAVRVAATLMYAGVKNVAILEGAHAMWAREGRPLTTVAPQIERRPYTAAVDSGSWVSTQ